MGIEPTSSAWKAEVLPLNYTRPVVYRAASRLLITCFTTTNAQKCQPRKKPECSSSNPALRSLLSLLGLAVDDSGRVVASF